MLADIKIKLWPVVMALGIIFSSFLIKPYILNAEYYNEKNLTSHTIWYPVYVGLAIDPQIREIYGHRDKVKAQGGFNVVCHEDHGDDSSRKAQARQWLCGHPEIAKPALAALDNFRLWLLRYTQNDKDGAQAVLKWLRDNGKTEEHLYTFGPEDKVGYPRFFGQCDSKEKFLQYDPSNAKLRTFDNTKDFKWREMDRIMGLVVKDAVIHHPILVLKVVFITKPFLFFLYYMMFFLKIKSLSGVVLIIITFGYLLFHIRKSTLVETQRLLILLFAVFAFSMIVTVMAYPAPHTISDQVLLLTLCILGVVLYLINKKWNLKKS